MDGGAPLAGGARALCSTYCKQGQGACFAPPSDVRSKMRAIPMNMDRPRRWLVLPVMLLVAVALGLLALLLVKANPAEGALPGDNGRIVFVSSGEIYTMMPDGTD